MPYLQLTDAGSITVQKDMKGAITHTNKGVVRRMFVVNEPFTQASSQRYKLSFVVHTETKKTENFSTI